MSSGIQTFEHPYLAFSGQLVPQDPNYEPASVLLERIRTERAAEVQAANASGNLLVARQQIDMYIQYV